MRVIQLIHTLNYGDAISGEALTIKRLLAEEGIQSELFGLHAHERVASEMRPLSDLKGHDQQWRDLSGADGTVVILHYSIGSPLNELYLGLRGVKRVLIYHNLTPAHWFATYNARVCDDLKRGISELPGLLAASDVLVADSDFNKSELQALGFDNVQVLPLVLDDIKWSVPENPGIGAVLAKTKGANWLHVGRLAPNKCVEDIIKAFYFYCHKISRDSKLWLVGHDIDTEIYSFELRRLIVHLHLEFNVSFVGSVADSELKSFYKHSQVYLCMSEHEGFCVPLIEAMYCGLPIIAYNSSAIAQTVGDAGLLLDKKKPALVAELANLVITDSEIREALVRNGKEQAARYGLPIFREKLKSLWQ